MARNETEQVRHLQRTLVLHSQSERQLSNWNAYGKVTSATRTHALAGPDAADAALANTRAGKPSQSNAPGSLCILRHCRKFSRNAAGPSSRGARSEERRVGKEERTRERRGD